MLTFLHDFIRFYNLFSSVCVFCSLCYSLSLFTLMASKSCLTTLMLLSITWREIMHCNAFTGWSTFAYLNHKCISRLPICTCKTGIHVTWKPDNLHVMGVLQKQVVVASVVFPRNQVSFVRHRFNINSQTNRCFFHRHTL